MPPTYTRGRWRFDDDTAAGAFSVYHEDALQEVVAHLDLESRGASAVPAYVNSIPPNRRELENLRQVAERAVWVVQDRRRPMRTF